MTKRWRIVIDFFLILLVLLILASKGDQGDESTPSAVAKGKVQIKHPSHQVIIWTTRFHGRIFRVIKLPRCEHIQTIITYKPPGETKEEAKKRLQGAAVCTASFYHRRLSRPVDFFRRLGRRITGQEVKTKRYFLAIYPDRHLEISKDYKKLASNDKVDLIALGQRLVPFHHDGFSAAFANERTDRMALGLTENRIYLVQARTDLWRLGKFLEKRLSCQIAVNCDGGHAVKGKSPFHLVFRWKVP